MKLKALKRAIVCILAGAMVVSSLSFTGCSMSSGDKPIRLDVFSSRANYEGLQGGWMGQVYLEKFNVELNIIKESGSTLTTMMQQGDLGDFQIWGGMTEDYVNCATQGLLLDWEEDDLLKECGSYMYANLNADFEQNRTYTDSGKIYGVSGNVSSSAEGIDDFFYAWDLRWDLYDQLGCPEVKDWDDLYNLFVSMKEAYPTTDAGLETYAMSLWPDWDGTMVMYVKCMAQAYYGLEGDWVLGLYDIEDGTYHDVLEKDGPYLKALEFLNRLYRAGLLDPDSMTQTYDDALAKLKNDRVFFSLFNYAGSTAYNTADNIAAGKAMYSMAPTDARTIVYGLSTTGTPSITFTIGANTKYPELCMEIIDWLFTPEGRMTVDYGPQGLCWYIGEDGLTYFTDLGKAIYDDPSIAIDDIADIGYTLPEEYEAYRGMVFDKGTNEMNIVTWNAKDINPLSGERYDAKYWASTQITPAAGSIEAKWREWAGDGIYSAQDYLESTNYKVAVACKYNKTSDKDADLKTLWSQVTEAIVQGTWNAIYQDTEEDFWAAVEKMDKDVRAYGNGTGYDQLVEWSQNECDLRHASEDAARAAAAKSE